MLIDVVMPKMGESIMDGRILKWHKKLGDKIEKDETLFDISTDKVDTEVPISDGGIIVELLYKEGFTVNVGDVVARVETDAGKAVIKETQNVTHPVVSKVEDVKTQTVETKKVELAPLFEEKRSETGEAQFFSPLVMSIASKEGVSMSELTTIKGTGIG